MASEPKEIVMYARERFCPDVTRARTRLTELGIPWREFDVESDPEAAEANHRLTGRRNVPTLVIGDRILVEPSRSQIDEALTAAGFDISEE